MPRLIDADAMRADWLENGQNEYVYDTNAVLDSIDEQPTVDAEPVRHGRWVFDGARANEDGDFVYDYICYDCGRSITVEYMGEFKEYPYCHCGAKMDLEN